MQVATWQWPPLLTDKSDWYSKRIYRVRSTSQEVFPIGAAHGGTASPYRSSVKLAFTLDQNRLTSIPSLRAICRIIAFLDQRTILASPNCWRFNRRAVGVSFIFGKILGQSRQLRQISMSLSVTMIILTASVPAPYFS
jgi:hypothetical protein